MSPRESAASHSEVGEQTRHQRQVITPKGWTDRQSGRETAWEVQRDLHPRPVLSVSIRPCPDREKVPGEAAPWR